MHTGLMQMSCNFGLAAALLWSLSADATANEGEALFKKQCGACHTLSADEPRRQGPALNGIIGRTAGKAEGFPYSKGLKQADWAWDEARLDTWMVDPKSVLADTYMIYEQNDADVRRRIISFLKTMQE